MRFFIILSVLLSNLVTAQLSKKHWIPPLHSRSNAQVEDHYLYLSTPVPTPFQVTVTNGAGVPFSGSPFTISQGNPVRIMIGTQQPSVMFLNKSDLNIVKSDKGLILNAPEEFYASFRVRSQNQAEILVSKGTSGIGTSFRLGSLPQTEDGGVRNFVASFMATEDNTSVTISDYDAQVEFSTAGVNNTNDTQTFLLNKGQSATVSGYTDVPANLTGFVGALVTSTKPIAVNTGNALGGMTSPFDGQDFTLDQIVSTEQVGTEYIVVKGNGSDEVEHPLVVATQDNTSVYVNGITTPIATINAGDYFLIPTSYYQGVNNQNMYITSSNPVYMYQIIGGDINNATPGLNFIPPLSCFFQKKVDLIPDVNQIGNTDYSGALMVLTYTGSVVKLNGVPVTAIPEPVIGNPTWNTYLLSGVTGNAKVESTGPLAVGVFGYNENAGYGGYYSGFGSEPKDTNVSVCSDRTTDLFNLIEGNPDPGGTWTPPLASGTGVFNPNVDAPGNYVYNFTGLCEIVYVTVTVTVQQALNPGVSTTKAICKNEPTFDLFALLGPNADSDGTWSPALASGSNIFNPAVDLSGVYTYTIVSNDVCENVSSTVTVTVNPVPIVNPITDFQKCDDNLDGNDANGIVNFNLTDKTTEILNGQTGITVTYHTSASDALNGIGAITSINSGNTIIHVRMKNNVTECISTTSFNLVVNPKPTISGPVTLKQCDIDQDAFTNFNLHEADILINNGNNLAFTYFTSQANAENNIAPISNDTAYPSGNNTVWVRVTNTVTGCYRTTALNLVVSATQIPATFTPILLQACDILDTTTTPNEAANDGYAFFNLAPTRATFLSLFTNPNNLTVTYYTSQADAEAETNAIDTSVPFKNTVIDYQPIFVRIDSNLNNDCIGLGNYLNLQVNPIPLVNLGNDFVLCVDPATGLGSHNIDATPAIPGNYSYHWTPANPVVDASGNESAQYNVTQAGIYQITVINSTTLCGNSDSISVTISSVPLTVTINQLTPLFYSGLASIEVIATGGYGSYEYSIDNGMNWQSSNIFTDLDNGSYVVLVRDLEHCGPPKASPEFFTVSYSNFFTPNGDGYNDTWKIDNLPPSYEAKIFIFDRFGKLLKQLNPDGSGWDGTYNGRLLPSTDYWFRVEYKEDGSQKSFMSHFSLKR